MTRHELKELQQDQFATKVTDAVEFASTHRSLVIRWSVIAVAIVALAWGGYWYYNHEKAERQAALRDAFDIAEASVGPIANPYTKNFPTQEAKDAATLKAFTGVATKYAGSKQGYLAEYWVALIRNDKGETAAAIQELRDVAGSSYSIAAMGKVSLANLLAGQGKYAEAEQILTGLVNKPTDLVSKEHAQILLARVLAKHDPKAANALLNSIDNGHPLGDRPAVIRAIQLVREELAQ